MVLGTPTTPEMKIGLEIMKLERLLKKIPWYSFQKKRECKKRLQELRDLAWNVGVSIAIKDLEEFGIITKE